MSRRNLAGLAIAVLILLYALSGAWVVQSLGRAYRASWLERSQASLTARRIDQPRGLSSVPDRSPTTAALSAGPVASEREATETNP